MLCSGNHDVGDKPTAAAIRRFQNVFGDDYFSWWMGNCKFNRLSHS